LKAAIFDTHNFEKPYLQKANKDAGHELNLLSVQLTKETAALAEEHQAIAIFGNDDASADVLEILHSVGVKYIALRSAGYNHIDIDKARELGIRAANVPAYSPYAVAEHTVALILALNRKLIRANRRILELNFTLDGLEGFDLNGKTVGIVGVGNIGSVVAKIMHGFGCKLLGLDPNPNQQNIDKYGMEYTDIDTLCRHSDIITLQAPLNDKTRYIINEEKISIMKDGVMIVNTGRGALINTKAAIEALKTRKIGYLGLDVYEEEKGLFFHDYSDNILQDDVIARLMTFPNVLITSHQAFLTKEALNNIAETTIENLTYWEDGKECENELT